MLRKIARNKVTRRELIAGTAAGAAATSSRFPAPVIAQTTPDYTPYIAQIADCDGIWQGFARSNPLSFIKQYDNEGLKYSVVTGETGGDDVLLKSFGDVAVGLISTTRST